MKKLLLIGNKNKYRENYQDYSEKFSEYIDNNFDLIFRYNHCNNIHLTGERIDDYFLEANSFFTHDFDTNENYKKECLSIFEKPKKLYMSPTWYNDMIKDDKYKRYNIPKRLIIKNCETIDFSVCEKEIGFTNNTHPRTIINLLAYILNSENYRDYQTYITGIDIYDRHYFDKPNVETNYGYHYNADIYEKKYLFKCVLRNDIKILEDIVNFSVFENPLTSI